MRQYLIQTLVVLLAGVLLVAGCTTADQAAMKRSLYVDEHPELPELMAEAILNGQIMVGMTEKMVETAWGKPARIEAVTEQEPVTSRWIYGNYFVGGNITSLYFSEEGLLARYEVDNQQTHTNNGILSEGAETVRTRSGDEFLLGTKGSRSP
jgi:hypothetical protein